MESIIRDLSDERSQLDLILTELKEEDWQARTPFDGWRISDTVSHLAYFDRAAFLSATDADKFTAEMMELIENVTEYDQIHERVNSKGADMRPDQLLAWWRREGNAFLEALETVDPKARLPWYGQEMGPKSSATARLMETWAHGLDILDTLGRAPEKTPRLKHIAHLGVATFGWSFKNQGMDIPETGVRVELEGPDNSEWTWGPGDTKDRIRGQALDFCMVVTQRRNPVDTGLEITGRTATQWMNIAQAFAGPPEKGPKPGER